MHNESEMHSNTGSTTLTACRCRSANGSRNVGWLLRSPTLFRRRSGVTVHPFSLCDFSRALECPSEGSGPTCPSVYVLQSLAECDRVVEQ